MAVASCYGHFLSAPSTLYPSSSLNPKQTKADSSTLHPSSFESEADESCPFLFTHPPL